MDELDQIRAAARETAQNQRKQYKLEEFVYDAREDLYWNIKDLSPYGRAAINALIPKDDWETEQVPGRNNSVREIQIKPASSIARIENDTVVECTTWWPGMSRIIKDVIVSNSGMDMPAKGRRMLNTYKAPVHIGGNAAMAGLWVEHIRKLWPDEAELLLDYFAHTVQKPQEKINYALVLVGEQGIGKDMMLTPVRMSVGENNSYEIAPDDLHSDYNSYVGGVLVIINEARPVNEDFKATDFYEKLKTLTTSPPNWLKMNGKYQQQRWVRNLMRVVITTNDPLALYVPDNDRRLYFCVSRLQTKWASGDYFKQLSNFYEAGGYAHVHSFLMVRDISKFNPKENPTPNAAHSSVVASWNTPIHDPLMDVLDDLGWPPAFFGGELLLSEVAAFDNKEEIMRLLKSSRKLASMMSRHGYNVLKSPLKQGWQFKENGRSFKSRVAFVRRDFVGDPLDFLERRGSEIAANGRAARPKVVPLKSV